MNVVGHPRIALTVSAARTPQNLAARERYAKALRERGADVIVLEPGAEIPADIDGVLFSGGGDVAPERYGEIDSDGVCENVIPERDELELSLARRALADDRPILGICRGFQLVNVALGGKLAMDVKGHQATGDEVVAHVVSANGPSKIAAISGTTPMRVNSRHHQAVTPDRLAPGLRATVMHDGLVEAFESDRHRWVVGVQWHPERTAEVDAAAVRIFDAFVAEAKRTPIRS